MSTTELTGLVARDPALAGLAAVLDDERRREALGRVGAGPAWAVSRIRYKPGSSIVASLTMATAEGAQVTGWIAAYSDPAKLQKTLYRARRAGFDARTVPGIPGLLVGETAADRLLSTPLARLRRLHPDLFARANVLRHNPHRRVLFRSVLAGTPVILKVQSGQDPAWTNRDLALDSLDLAGVPVLRPTKLAGLAQAETLPWWGRGDLAALPLTALPLAAAARSAGHDLARLHEVNLGAAQNGAARDRAENRATENRAAVRSIAAILPDAAAQARSIAARLRPAAATAERLTVVHGDFSPDQVLVGDGPPDDSPAGEGHTRLIDFDRAAIDSPERDLGSFLASADLLGRTELGLAMLEGYTAAGGTVEQHRLHRYTATAFLQRAVDPFRTLSPDWAERTRHALHRAESEAARC